MAKPSVAFFTMLPIYGWAFLADIAKVLRNKGCKIYWVQPEEPIKIECQKSFSVISFKKVRFLEFVLLPIKKASPLLSQTLTSVLNYEAYLTLFSLAKKIDVIICQNINYFFQAALVSKLARKPLIFLFTDLNFVKYFRANRSRQRRDNLFLLYFLLAAEKTSAGLADKVVTLSENDKAIINSWGVNEDKIEVIPLSIDLKKVEKRLALRSRREKVFSKLRALKAKGNKIVVFHGSLWYWTNEFACRYIVNELAPRVSQKYSDAIFVIIGAPIPEDLISKSDKVIFTGFVRDLFSYIDLADVAVAPLTSGSGVKNKMLEYFGLSKPVVTTTFGVDGLQVKDMVHCSIAKSLDAFPERLVFLLEHPGIAVEMGRQAKNYVEDKHALKNYERYFDLIHEMVNAE